MKKEYQEDSFMKGKKFLAMILSACLLYTSDAADE